MADQFQIPQAQRNPQPVTPPMPTDLINAYLQRQFQGQQNAISNLGGAAKDYVNYLQQNKQNQAASIGAIGPSFTNQVYGTNYQFPGMGGQQQPAQMPQTNMNDSSFSQTPGMEQSGDSDTNPNPQQTPPPLPMGQGQTQGAVGSPTPTNGVSSPQPSAQTMPSGQPMSAGTNNVGQDTSWQPGQPMMHPTSGLPQTIHDSVAQGLPDHAGVLSQGPSPMQQQALGMMGMSNPSQALGMGAAGARVLGTYKELGDLALQPGQQQLQQQALQKGQFEQSQQPTVAAKAASDLSNSQSQVPTEIGKASAEQQNKYSLPETKIQTAASKLQDLYDAYQKVPDSAKGATVGIATSQAGSAAGKVAPNVVTYNKLREQVATSLAIAKNPENPRPNPQDIQDELKNLPSLGDDPAVAKNLFQASASDLTRQHTLNTRTYQSAAQAFGGSITPGQSPQFNFGGNNGGAITKTIGNITYVKKNGQWYQQ